MWNVLVVGRRTKLIPLRFVGLFRSVTYSIVFCMCNCIDEEQLIPQVVINYQRHNAVGLQPTMMMLWAWAGVPLGVYNIVKDFNIALQIQPQILTLLSLVTWIQCYYYEKVAYLALRQEHYSTDFERRNGRFCAP